MSSTTDPQRRNEICKLGLRGTRGNQYGKQDARGFGRRIEVPVEKPYKRGYPPTAMGTGLLLPSVLGCWSSFRTSRFFDTLEDR